MKVTGSLRKIKLNGDLKYAHLLDTLKQEYKMDESMKCELLTATHESVSTTFTVKDYYEASQAKYVGATRIYLGFRPCWLDDQIDKDEAKYYLLQNLEHENAEEDHTIPG